MYKRQQQPQAVARSTGSPARRATAREGYVETASWVVAETEANGALRTLLGDARGGHTTDFLHTDDNRIVRGAAHYVEEDHVIAARSPVAGHRGPGSGLDGHRRLG